MRIRRSKIKFHMLFLIFILHQVTKTFSASVQVSERFKILQNGKMPTNLSEIIEYMPSDFPTESANMSVSSELQEQTGGRRVETFRLKTFLHVENDKNFSNSERQRKDLVMKSSVSTNSTNNDSPSGLSLNNTDGWNKRVFIHSKIESNKTKYSLDDLEYLPGEVEMHVSENLKKALESTARDPDRNKPGLAATAAKPFGLSLDDGGWRKKPFVRGTVERNETKASLSDIEYEPEDVLMNNPGILYRMFYGSSEDQEESRFPEEVEYVPLNPESEDGWETQLLRDTVKKSRKSSQGDNDYMSDKSSSDSSEDFEEYWYGRGKVEKLYYSNGQKTWKEFPGTYKTVGDKRLPQNEEAPLYRRGRELSYSSRSDDTFKKSSSSKSDESGEYTYDAQEHHRHKVVAKDIRRSQMAKSRQFVFHPYLPYGKDVPADEKIKFNDIFPVRMVKFVKSMVEEAPWEQMFIKMVRMVVDQFVDKIIEKMFADKGNEHLKKRSVETLFDDSWNVPTFAATPVVRVRRTVNAKKDTQRDEDLFAELHNNRDPQGTNAKEKKTEEERKAWLDHFLDYVFPNSKSEESDHLKNTRLTKRDTNNAHLFRILISYFLNYFEKTSEIITDAKDALRYKMLKDILPYLYQKRFLKPGVADGSSNSVDSIEMSPRDVTEELQSDKKENPAHRSLRKKRSIEEEMRKEGDSSKRLWQESSRRHKPHHRRVRDDCSLRRACNAGRFLSRLPAVEEITLQLKSQGNGPHWDAMIWGMKRKRCSRIFCKRQRSPKGSRHSWNTDKDRPSRKLEFVTEPPTEMDEIANLAR